MDCPPDKELNPITKKCVKKCSPNKRRVFNETKKQFACYKNCEEGEQINPETNRCVKIKTTQKQAKKTSPKHKTPTTDKNEKPGSHECPPDKVLNPITKKCVKKCSPDKRRVFNETQKIFACLKNCKEGQHINPKTNRCVKDKTMKNTNSQKPRKKSLSFEPQVDDNPEPGVPNTITTNTICDNEDKFLKEYDTHYIHIFDRYTREYLSKNADSNSDNHKVMYNKTDKNIIAKLHERITKSCNKKNIIIYVLLQNLSVKNKFLDLFNHFLHFGLEHKYYSNIMIFSFFNLSYIFPQPSERDEFKSLLVSNVIDKTTNFKKFFKVLNITHCSTNVKDFTEISKNQELSYKFMKSVYLYDYYKVKSLVLERKCSTGKLIQFSGTCWMNSIMNLLLLPKKMRNIMMLQCKKYIDTASSEEEKRKYTTPLFEIYDSRNTLEINHIITAITYHVFIKKERLIIDKEDKHNPKYNFMLVLADKIKRLYYKLTYGNVNVIKFITTNPELEDHCKKMEFHYKNNDVVFGDGATYEVRYFTMQYIEETYLFHYNDKIIFKHYREISDETKVPVLNTRTFVRNNQNFVLTSAYLVNVNITHAICGFICEDKEYIYNSNLYSAVETKWTENDYSNYKDYLTSKNMRKKEHEFHMEHVLYVKDEDHEKEKNQEIQSIQENIPNMPCPRTPSFSPPPPPP